MIGPIENVLLNVRIRTMVGTEAVYVEYMDYSLVAILNCTFLPWVWTTEGAGVDARGGAAKHHHHLMLRGLRVSGLIHRAVLHAAVCDVSDMLRVITFCYCNLLYN